MQWLTDLFDGSFMPHGHCLLWRADLLSMHVLGDALTAAAYFVIPAALIYLVRHREDLAFNWVFVMFAAFIFACGATHLIEIYNIWHGYYYAEGMLKLATGAVSAATAIMVWPLVPKVVALPSRSQLLGTNRALATAEDELRTVNRQLEARVEARTRALTEQTRALLRANEELERLAVTDPLTGISNRRHLRDRLEKELERCDRYGGRLSLILLDLDDFKGINDNHGHAAGDAVLQHVAKRLVTLVRSTDVAGRFGGEEFLIILPNTGRDDARALAERVRTDIAAAPVRAGGTPVHVTCSLGVAEGGRAGGADALLSITDGALYAAKREGKNRVSGAGPARVVRSR